MALRRAEQPVKPVSFWWLFAGSLDRRRDVVLIQQVLFWAEINHPHDSIVNIEVPNVGDQSEYNYFLKQFTVEGLPCLVLGDDPASPNHFIRFSPGFFTENLLGKGYEKTRDVLDRYHNTIVNRGSLAAVKSQVLQSQLTSVLGVLWREVKDLVSINVAAAG